MGFGTRGQTRQRARSTARISTSGKDDSKVFTWGEVKEHCKKGDAWVVIGGRVYDVSQWREHPGGEVIWTHAGKEATGVFSGFHPPSAWETLRPFQIGRVDKPSPLANVEFESELRDLRVKMKKEGLFKASGLYYAYKLASNVAICAASFYFLSQADTLLGVFGAACLMGLFWQQCGWLAHDFLHHQVFKQRSLGDLMGILVGNIFQGFSVEWWKNKHNTHHAVPNVTVAQEGHIGDPDIDTMPLLAWSLHHARTISTSNEKAIVAWQAWTYFPILFFARMSWAHQSFCYAFKLAGGWMYGEAGEELRLGWLEPGGIALHYAWFLGGTLYLAGSWTAVALFILASQCMCGLFLAVAFGVGHNGMSVYASNSVPGFSAHQITTTRNVDDDFLGFSGWFTGGLHYQIEHHLYPQIPRHNLPRVRELVEPLCKKHGIPYHSTDLLTGTWEVLKHLDEVAEDVIKHFPAL